MGHHQCSQSAPQSSLLLAPGPEHAREHNERPTAGRVPFDRLAMGRVGLRGSGKCLSEKGLCGLAGAAWVAVLRRWGCAW